MYKANVRTRLENLYVARCSCRDYIVVHDGSDAVTPQLRRFCADAGNQTIVSTGDRLFVQFVSDDRFEAQGFAASFRFIPRDQLITSVAVTSPSYTSGKQCWIKAVITNYVRFDFASTVIQRRSTPTRLQFDRDTTIRRPTLRPSACLCMGCCTAAEINK